MIQENLIDNDLRIDEVAISNLNETAKWAKFLAVVGFVLTGLIILVAIFAGSILSTLSRSGEAPGMIAMSSGVLTITYLIVGGIYFFMSLYLYRFASNMQVALSAASQENLNISFHNLKNLYKIMGIITIVYLGILVIAMILGITAAMFFGR